MAATDVRHLAAINASYDLPFGNNHLILGDATHLVNAVISGWTLSPIATLETGFPFNPQLGYNPTGSGDSRNPVRPNRNPAFTGYDDLDFSLAKTTQVNERVRTQFRAEFFNILNHTNLGIPAETVFSGGPTQGTAASQTTVAALSPTAGVVTSAATTRQIQLGLKFLF
jgi:hypothetical protein